GGREVIRTIAGIPYETASRQSVVDQDLIDRVRAAMFGWTALSVEGGAPTYAAWLDDALVTRRSWRTMIEAGGSGSALVEAVKARLQAIPPELPILHTPLVSSTEAMTLEVGPRMVLISRTPIWEGGEIRKADILPFTSFHTVGPGAAEAARKTAERTSLLAAAEELLFDKSTVAILGSRSLRELGPFDQPDPSHPHAPLLRSYMGSTRLIPDDDGEFAFWSVDQRGTVIGVLPDGSGGGSSTTTPNQQCKAANQASAIADLYNGAMGMPWAYGAFVALGSAIAKQALREAAIIASLGGPTPDTSGCGGPTDVPCDVGKGFVFDNLPYGKALSAFDAATKAATGNDFFKC
ncbi:MAG: hypothetical protein OEM39_09390, partial [Acidimicrobiia bacterium]|nr:hypothetical protein [Acidimicrobiia bacterium]